MKNKTKLKMIPECNSLQRIVLIIDRQDKRAEKQEFVSLEAALAFKEGMEFAWNMSRGMYVPDCTSILCLGDERDYEEWGDLDFLGLEEVVHLL